MTRRMVPDREMARYIHGLVKSGSWTAERTNAGHIRLVHCSGRIYFTGSTPSDRRSILNLKAAIRRIERQEVRQ